MPTAALLLAFLALSALPAALGAQSAPDPRTAKPERPTVATHAWTVAPAYAEIETGIEWDDNRDGTHLLSTPTLVKIGLTTRTQLGVATQLSRASGSGIGVGDLSVALKHRVADQLPVLGAFAIIPSLKLPTASSTHGTGTTDVSVLLVSSHSLGDLSIDVNLGYTHRFGDASRAPRNATMWTVSAGLPLKGPLGVTAEIFGFPATRGPAGSPGTMALLAGPTLIVKPWWVLDLGGILHLAGPQPDALYAGLVYNIGRVF